MSNPNEGKVVSFTNVTAQDFTHNFGGVPYFVPAGETVMFPYHLARHLAKHLSRKILLGEDKGAQAYDPKDETMKNGNGTVLWNETTEKKMMDKILGESFSHEVARPKTEVELMREQIAELNKFKEQFIEKNNLKPSAPVPELPSSEGFKDKGEIISELKKLGIPVDARKSKATLEAQLKEAQTAKA